MISPASSSLIQPRVVARYEPYELADLVGTMTEEEFAAFDKNTREKHQLIHGKVVRMPGSSPEHNMIVMDTAVALSMQLAERDCGCEVIGSDQKVYVTEQTIFYPDVIIVCGDPQFDHLDALRNPTALIEVLSPSTEKNDRTDKFYDYQKIESLRYYILIEQDRYAVTVYGKLDNGLWAITGNYLSPTDSMELVLNSSDIAIPLSRIYRRVALDMNESGK